MSILIEKNFSTLLVKFNDPKHNTRLVYPNETIHVTWPDGYEFKGTFTYKPGMKVEVRAQR